MANHKKHAPEEGLTRRGFVGGAGGLILVALSGCSAAEDDEPPWGVILSDPALCGACSRCAITCSALNAGGPSAATALVGPDRYYQELQLEAGGWLAATCRMCPEVEEDGRLISPACVASCPAGAAQIAPDGHALYGSSRVRFIDQTRCLGCGTCVAVCPYSHPLLDLQLGKARKCDLCLGRWAEPPCVDACPACALRYYRVWREEVRRPFPWLHPIWGTTA